MDRPCIQAAAADPPGPLLLHQARPHQYLQMPRHRLQRDVEMRRHFLNQQVLAIQPVEDRPPDGIGQRAEDQAERLLLIPFQEVAQIDSRLPEQAEPKLAAREMIAMTNAMNKEHFKGKRELTCTSCHNGATHPAGMPPVQESDEAAPKPAFRASGPTPTADQILEQYVEALGGAEAIQKVTSRVMKGVIHAGGHAMDEQVQEEGFLTRDSRVVERKKYGKAKARRSFQFSKR